MTDSIADRLREARKLHFKRAVEAAEGLGVPYQTYIAHENGNRSFDVDAAILYARRFKVSLDWLLTGVGRGPGNVDVEEPIEGDTAVLAFLRRIPGLNDVDINTAFAVIRNALDAKRAAPAPSESRDQQQPASPRRELEPSGKKVPQRAS